MTPQHKIKLTLKPFLRSKEHYSILIKRIMDVHREMVDIKLSFLSDYTLNKTIIFHTTRADIPTWCSDLLPLLSEYLSVHMYQVSFLRDNYTEPSKTIMVLGSQDQTQLAKVYLNFLIPSVDAFVYNHKLDLEREAKRIREQIRDGKKDETARMEDIRRQSSNFRREIIEYLKTELTKLLEYHKTTDPIAFTRGLHRRAQIKAKIEHNGVKIWRNTKLLGNFLKKA